MTAQRLGSDCCHGRPGAADSGMDCGFDSRAAAPLIVTVIHWTQDSVCHQTAYGPWTAQPDDSHFGVAYADRRIAERKAEAIRRRARHKRDRAQLAARRTAGLGARHARKAR